MDKEKIKSRLKAMCEDDKILGDVAEILISIGAFSDMYDKPISKNAEYYRERLSVPNNYKITASMGTERITDPTHQDIDSSPNYNRFETSEEAGIYSRHFDAVNKLRIIRELIS